MASFASVFNSPNSPANSSAFGDDEIFHDAPTHQMPPPPAAARRGLRTAAGTSIPWDRIHEIHTSQLRGHLRFLRMFAESKGYTAKVSEFIARTEMLLSDAEALKPTSAAPSHTTATNTTHEKRRGPAGAGRQSSKRPKTQHRSLRSPVSILGKRSREEEAEEEAEADAEESTATSLKKRRTAYMAVDPAELSYESDDSDSESDSDSKEGEEEVQPPAPGNTEPETTAPQKKRAGETQDSRARTKKQRRRKGSPGSLVTAPSPKRGAEVANDECGRKRLRFR